MREVRRAMAHRDLSRHADPLEGFFFLGLRVLLRPTRMEVDIDDRGRQELDRRKTLIEGPHRAKLLDQRRGHRLARLVVARERVERRAVVAPVLPLCGGFGAFRGSSGFKGCQRFRVGSVRFGLV